MYITRVHRYHRLQTYSYLINFQHRRLFSTHMLVCKFDLCFNRFPQLIDHKCLFSTEKSFTSNLSNSQPTTTHKSNISPTLVNKSDVVPKEESVFIPDALYRRIVVEVLSHDSGVLDSYERFVVAASIHLGIQVPPIISDPFLRTLPSSLLTASKRNERKPIMIRKQHITPNKRLDGTSTKDSKREPDLGALLKTFARPGSPSSDALLQTRPGSDIQTATDPTSVEDATLSNRSPYFGALLDVQRPPYSIWLRTLLKSVHVYKSHRVQYEIRSHACVFTVLYSFDSCDLFELLRFYAVRLT